MDDVILGVPTVLEVVSLQIGVMSVLLAVTLEMRTPLLLVIQVEGSM